MSTDRPNLAERLRSNFDRVAPVPAVVGQEFARLLAERLRDRGLPVPERLESHTISVSHAVSLVVRNVDMLGSLRQAIAQASAPVLGSETNPEVRDLAAETLFDVIRRLNGPLWSDLLAEDWSDVMDAAVEVMFGTGAGRAVLAA